MFVWRHGKWQPFFFLPKMPNKHHRMRNELVLSAKSAEHSAFSLWLNSENALFSMVMESSKWLNSEKISFKVCGLKNNPHLCNVVHLKQAESTADFTVGIFCVHGLPYTYSSVPCGALMRPLPVSGVRQRGAELFLFLPILINILFHF